MHILVTNDDGVFAPGLLALAQALRPLGDVTVLAPDRNWSASGHVKTLNRPLRVFPVTLEDGSPAYACDGAPSDCVALPLLGLLDRKVDVVVSGINPNANLGHDVTYSGTVTAAMEAVIGGVPGVAVSLDSPNEHHGTLRYDAAARVGREVVEKVLAHGLPEGVLLSVNVPYGRYEEFKGFRLTRQGVRVYNDKLVRRTDPQGRPYYWIGGDPPSAIPEEDTDYWALQAGYVSITPLHLDLTAYTAMTTLQAWWV
ncbi:MAG: 5'/3'-nucleotidase SurE [Anaerolineae bacterium]|nr:MAG: 5'/3'-nucleotidase SurE [Anaerolineae bacterium]